MPPHDDGTRGTTEDNATEVRYLYLQFRIGEAGINLLVEFADDPGRCPCRCAAAEISARLIARHKFPTVGRSGSECERVAVHTASARRSRQAWYRNRPALVGEKID